MKRRFVCGFVLVNALCVAGCSRRDDGLEVYRATNNQAGHEFVKTEQFLVPVGSVITIDSIDFAPGTSMLSVKQQRIVQQVFNSIEEITENTVNDTSVARVAEHKKMEFEIQGFPDNSDNPAVDSLLASARATTVMNRLSELGTPSWRLKARGMPAERARKGTVVFLRTR